MYSPLRLFTSRFVRIFTEMSRQLYVVHQVLEGQRDGIRCAPRSHAVIAVIDGDVPDAQRREDLLQIVPGINVIAGKAAEILADGAVYPALPHVLKHPLEPGAIRVRPGVAVVFIIDFHQLQVGCREMYSMQMAFWLSLYSICCTSILKTQCSSMQ